MASHVELLFGVLQHLGNEEFKHFQWFLKQDGIVEGFRAIPKCQLEEADRQDTVDKMVEAYSRPGALQITVEVLKKINRNDLVEEFSKIGPDPSENAIDVGKVSENAGGSCIQQAGLAHCPTAGAQDEDLWVQRPKPPRHIRSYQRMLQSNLQNKFMCIPEGSSMLKDKKLLGDIYTDVYIIDGNDVDDEQHEVRRIEMTSRKPKETERSIPHNDMFKHSSGENTPVRTVLTSGIAGIGKTFLVYKFILDWAEGRANQDVHLIFPFTFRQLNLLKGRRFCFAELIHKCIRESRDIEKEALDDIFNKLQASGNTNYDKSNFKLLFVLDGLDESRFQLHFDDEEECSVNEPMLVNELLACLIKGKLLPSARLWITTRPAAANQIPLNVVDIMTEVRGFTDPQKEEYFRKRFKDEKMADRIISHIKTSQSLHIMCHIPVFCWITASVLKQMSREDETNEIPQTLTEMYAKFLVFQIKQMAVKYDTNKNIKIIKSLAKLAFHQLQTRNVIFYETDLKNSGIHLGEASVYSGVFTQIFKEEDGLNEDKMFCFVHLSIHEFLAAVFVVLSLINDKKDVMAAMQTPLQRVQMLFRRASQTEVCMKAVDMALQSPNGHLDLFLRFLLGLLLKSNQDLLQGLLKQSSTESNLEIVKYIHKKIRENPSPERCINLFYCLSEMKDCSLVEDIQHYLRSGNLSTARFLPAQWSALVYMLLLSGKELDVFDLKKYSKSEEVLMRMLPLVKASTSALLDQCELSHLSCEALASVLSSQSSSLRKLDLNINNLRDSGVKLLCVGLESPHCRLENLRLSSCEVTVEGCFSLACALGSNPSHLEEPDLSYRQPGRRKRSCAVLAPVLSTKSSSLRKLDLSDNDLEDSGVQLLSAELQSPDCRLETLGLAGCLVTEEGCASLASALTVNTSHLRELDLSYNHPGDSGVELLTARLEDPQCSLETLRGNHADACELTLDPNTAYKGIALSRSDREATVGRVEQPYPHHPERFDYRYHVLCTNGLTGRCYWEVEWRGVIDVGVAYKGITRKGRQDDSLLGWNEKSWCLDCIKDTAWHNGRATVASIARNHRFNRVAVYLDWSAGTLSFYRVSSDGLIHLHTFHCTFTEPLYPALRLSGTGSSALLC
ncbi:NACHT, LRR and PYD domains-containing protein 3-like [Symphorus nematophorus]